MLLQEADQRRLDVAAAGRDTPLPDAPSTPDPKAKGKAAAPAKPPAKGSKGAPAAEPAAVDSTMNAPASSEDVAAAVDKVLQAAKASVKASSDTFYAKRDAKRPLTRPNELPEKQADLIEKVMKEVGELSAQAQDHVATGARALRLQVSCTPLRFECCRDRQKPRHRHRVHTDIKIVKLGLRFAAA